MDAAKLAALEGEQVCASCGATELNPDDCEVYDLEVVCMDCLYTYHYPVYARRTGDTLPDD